MRVQGTATLSEMTGWQRLGVTRIEDFHDAVKGAGLDAVQLSRGRMTGSLAFASDGGIQITSGQIGGRVRLSGPLSETMVTLGIGIDLAPGTRHWMREVETGNIGVFMAGDAHDAIYTPGTHYAAATLPPDLLEERAADIGYVLDARQLGRTGVCDRRAGRAVTRRLRSALRRVHRGATSPEGLGQALLNAMIGVLAREPRAIPPHDARSGHGRIVTLSLEFIRENLEEPLYISAIARASCTSQATLYRAFHRVLDETPQSYVRKLRLNRIRHDLASDAEARCTIATIANRWGVTELGRLAGWYRDAFGELPSETRARHLQANITEQDFGLPTKLRISA
jgi:AraC-like DNA-binding protein